MPSRIPRLSPVRAFLLAFSLSVVGWLAPGTPARAEDAPRAVVQGFYDTLLSAMKDGPKLGFQGRFERIRPAFDKAFDAPVMTRVVVGPGWTGLPEEQQRQAVEAFTRYSVANYAANFREYGGERLEVQDERAVSAGTVVATQIVPGGDAPTGINYLLRRTAGGVWKIVDVYLDRTISELATRRSDFAATIRDEGVPGLIARLDAKTQQIAGAQR